MKNSIIKLLKKKMVFNKNLGSSQLYTAFTLAEVLITLGIIGIVASITIPILSKNISQIQYKTAWKKEYGTLYNAFNLILAENAGSIKNVCPKIDYTTDSRCLMDLFTEKMRVQKKCASTVGCWHTDPLPKKLSGVDITFNGPNYPSMILQDGTLMKFHAGTGDCSNGNTCISVSVDTNGFKQPNILGKDVFLIYVNATKLAFEAGTSDCKLDPPSGDGYGCAMKYLIE